MRRLLSVSRQKQFLICCQKWCSQSEICRLTETLPPLIVVYMDMVAEKLDAINQTLERQNKITQGMLELMRKPVNPLLKILL